MFFLVYILSWLFCIGSIYSSGNAPRGHLQPLGHQRPPSTDVPELGDFPFPKVLFLKPLYLPKQNRSTDGYSKFKNPEKSSGEIGLDIRTYASPKVGQDQVSEGVSVLCWHAAPVAYVLWKPCTIRWKSNSVIRSISGTVKNWCDVLSMEGVTVCGRHKS